MTNKTFTDAEIRIAILRAARTRPLNISADHNETYVAVHEVTSLRSILNQLFLELPDEPGSIIQNVTDEHGRNYRVMSLDSEGDWVGVTTSEHTFEYMRPGSIASWEPLEDD